MKKTIRLFSMLLSIALIFQAAPVFANETDPQISEEYELYRLATAGSEELVDAYPGGLLELAETEYSLDVDSGKESDIIVLRRGGTQGSAQVTLAFLDVSARYGVDYKIKQDGEYVESGENSQSMMDAFIDQSEMNLSGSADKLSITMLDAPRDMTEEEVSQYQQEQEPAESKEGKSLREMRNEALGVVSDRPSVSETPQAETEKAESYFEENAYLQLSLDFEDGEFEKRLSIEMLPSGVYHTDKQVVFMMINPEGAETGDNVQGVMNLYTNREPETAFISNEEYVYTENGFVHLVLTKTGALGAYTVVQVSTADAEAKAGSDYTAYEANVVFVPGATERVVRIPISETAQIGDFTVNLSAQGKVELETPLITASTGAAPRLMMYPEVVNNSKVDVLWAEDFSPTTWYSKKPYIKYVNNWPVWMIDGTYGSIKSKNMEFYGYAGLEIGWSNSLSYATNRVEYNKLALFKANGTTHKDIYNAADKKKGWTQTIYSLSDDDIKNSAYLDVATKSEKTKKNMNMQLDWVRLYKQPYVFNIDINKGANKEQYGNWNDYYHEQYTWKGPSPEGKELKNPEAPSGTISVLGKAKSESSDALYKDEAVNFDIAPNQGMYFSHYKIASSTEQTTSHYKTLQSPSPSITLNAAFLKDYFAYKGKKGNSAYGRTDIIKNVHEYTVRPVFKRLTSTVRVKWKATQGGVASLGGDVETYKNNIPFTVPQYDDVEINVTTKAGYVPTGIRVNGKLIPAGSDNPYLYNVSIEEDTTIELLFEPTLFRVAPDYSIPKNTNNFSDVFMSLDGDQRNNVRKAGIVEEGNGQTIVSTDVNNGIYDIWIEPAFLGTAYNVGMLPTEGAGGRQRIPVWVDATGIKNLAMGEAGGVDDYLLNLKKTDPMRYIDMKTAVYGLTRSFVPLHRNSALYYRMVDLDTAARGYTQGTVKIKTANIFQTLGAASDKSEPVEGALVTLQGLRDENGNMPVTYTDANGEFSFSNIVGLSLGNRYTISIEYNGELLYSYCIGGANHTEYVFDPAKIMVPYDMRCYESGTAENPENDTIIDRSDVIYDTQHYSFTFSFSSEEPDIAPAKAYVVVTDKDGRDIMTYQAQDVTYLESGVRFNKPTKRFMVREICPMSLRNEYPAMTTAGIASTPLMATAGRGGKIYVYCVDASGTVYPRVDTGVKFMGSLTSNTKISFLLHEDDSETTVQNIPLLGPVDGLISYDLEVLDKEPTDKNIKIPFFAPTYDENNDFKGRVATFGLGMSIPTGRPKDPTDPNSSEPSKIITSNPDLSAIRSVIQTADYETLDAITQDAMGQGKSDVVQGMVPISLKSGIMIDFGARLELVYDHENDEYVFSTLVGMANLIVTAGKNDLLFSFPIGPVPVVITMGLQAQAFMILAMDFEDKESDAPRVDSDTGLINWESENYYNQINTKASFRIQIILQAGVGVKNFSLSVFGDGSITFYFDNFKKGSGVVTLGVGVILRVLFFEFPFTIWDDAWTIYEYDYSNIQGSVAQQMNEATAKLMATPVNEIKPISRAYLDARHDYAAGPQMFSVQDADGPRPLQTAIYPYPESKLIDISTDSEEKIMMLFLNDDVNQPNNSRATLFFSIYQNGIWSRPNRVDTSELPIYSFDAADMGDGRILVSYETSTEVIRDNQGLADALDRMTIATIVYNKDDGYFEAPLNIADDGAHSYSNPKAIRDPNSGEMIIFYTATDYDEGIDTSAADTTIGDIVNSYYTLCYKTWDGTSLSAQQFLDTTHSLIITEEDVYTHVNENDVDGRPIEGTVLERYKNQTVSVNPSPITDPYILEYAATPAYDEATDEYYAIITYTADGDNDISTIRDQQVFMQLYSFGTKTMSKPVQVTNNGRRNSKLQFAHFENNRNILLWVADTDPGDADPNSPQEELSDLMGFTPADLLTRIKMYEGHPYIDKGLGDADEYEGEFATVVVSCPGGDSLQSFESHVANNEVFLTWLTASKTDEGSVKYSANAMKYIAVETAANEYMFTRSLPFVMDMGENSDSISDISMLTLRDGDMLLVWNKYASGDGAVNGDRIRDMYTMRKTPAPNLVMTEDDLTVEGKIRPGETLSLSATVKNNAFAEKTGNVKMELYIVQDGTETLIDSNMAVSITEQEGILTGGDTLTASTSITLGETLTGMSLKAVVKDDSGVILTVTKPIEAKPALSFISATNARMISQSEAEMTYSLYNGGDKAFTGVIEAAQANGAVLASVPVTIEVDSESVGTVTVPIDSSMWLESAAPDGGYLEQVRLEARAGDALDSVVLSRSVTAEQKSAMESLTAFDKKIAPVSLEAGTTSALDSGFITDSLDVETVFISSDSTVAEVDTNGVITGNKAGQTTVTVYSAPANYMIDVNSDGFVRLDNTPNIPAQYIKTKEIPVTVTSSSPGINSTGSLSTSSGSSRPTQWMNTSGFINPFIDVAQDAWYYDDAAFAVVNELFRGISNTEFAPDITMTRAMFVTVMHRFSGHPAHSGLSSFEDVPADTWYADAVAWAAENDIVKGIGENLFAPEVEVTREQAAAILYRWAQYTGIAPEGAWAIQMDFADLEEVSDWASEAMMYCVMRGIIKGKPGQLLDPKGMSTRAEMAAMMHRLANTVG